MGIEHHLLLGPGWLLPRGDELKTQRSGTVSLMAVQTDLKQMYANFYTKFHFVQS